MEPVVNGLEENYGSEIDLRRLDANSDNGRSAFRYYKLLGHPSYIILDSEGKVLWSGLGELTEAQLSQQIADILSQP